LRELGDLRPGWREGADLPTAVRMVAGALKRALRPQTDGDRNGVVPSLRVRARSWVDKHVLLWWLADDPSLGDEARKSTSASDSSVFVSAASAWEIAIKRALGKLDAPSDLVRQIELNRFAPLPTTVSHAYAAGALPRHHDDPFDRVLVAQATAEGLILVTRDPRMRLYGVGTLAA
jgi:PIN domain nuclease of toxin-antitoxin system